MLHQRIGCTFVTDGTSTSAVYIGDAKRVGVEIATFAAGLITATANIFFQGAKTSTGTFRRIQAMGVYSGNSGIYDVEIPSSTGNRIYIIDALIGFDHIKLETSKTATAQLDCAIHVWR